MRIDLVARRLLDMLTRKLPTDSSRYQITETLNGHHAGIYRLSFSNDGGKTWHPVKGYHVSLSRYSDTKVWHTHAKEHVMDLLAYFKGVSTETTRVVFDTEKDSLEEYMRKEAREGDR